MLFTEQEVHMIKLLGIKFRNILIGIITRLNVTVIHLIIINSKLMTITISPVIFNMTSLTECFGYLSLCTSHK